MFNIRKCSQLATRKSAFPLMQLARSYATYAAAAAAVKPQAETVDRNKLQELVAFGTKAANVGPTETAVGSNLTNTHYSEFSPEASCVELQRAGSGERPLNEDHLVFYFEMSTTRGKKGYSYIARQVFASQLPGECENYASIGFATWRVPKNDYVNLLTMRQPIA